MRGTGQAPNGQEVVARRGRLAAKQARRVRATDGAQQLGGTGQAPNRQEHPSELAESPLHTVPKLRILATTSMLEYQQRGIERLDAAARRLS
ncbi:MAG: hypothetical protein RBU37_01150 [Myxococcota bacterium]|nr:hypothetical protein [Myxococcota bacterium]